MSVIIELNYVPRDSILSYISINIISISGISKIEVLPRKTTTILCFSPPFNMFSLKMKTIYETSFVLLYKRVWTSC